MFGRKFRLLRRRGPRGLYEYTLQSRPLRERRFPAGVSNQSPVPFFPSKATALVQRLIREDSNLDRVSKRIRTDPLLTEPLRRVAWGFLLQWRTKRG